MPSRITEQTNPERGALELIKQHGKEARAVAERRADGCELAGASESAEQWRRIARTVRQIESGNAEQATRAATQ
jgi:hypothetical protein